VTEPEKKPPPGAAGTVAIILAVGVAVALNVITGAILFAAYVRLGIDVDAGISENGTQLLTGAFGGIIGALSAYMGYTLGRKNGENGQSEKPLEPPKP
jgi:hypothetical protein